ncbi:MAG: TonB-dependent receptor [Acidobacteriota bacterium]
MKSLLAAALLATLTTPLAFANSAAIEDPSDATASTPSCPNGSPLAGTVRDATDALIPGAKIQLDSTVNTQTAASDGHFLFPCLTRGAHHLTITSEGFASQTLNISAPHNTHLVVTLALASVETQVDVDTTTTAANSANSSGPTQTISGSRLQALADDPDDLQRELQQLAGALGGANATISVDGFEGSSALPPKSSIAYIVVNPDQFSAQYREPPFDGGRVEIYTKPGAKTFHGALFAVNGSPWMNARDPFSTSKAALGKQRYGFELSGPVTKKNSDFAITLEHRSIDDFAVIDATTLDNSGNPINVFANVATPQRLWLATARYDLQLGAKNTLIATYSANVNHLLNQGVGGSSLAETGYDSQTYEHMFRLSSVTTASAHLMHEARASFRFDGEIDNPTSLAPQVSVAGAFTSGGASIGAQRHREFNLEYDDDAILTTKSHTFKFGIVFNTWTEHYQFRTNFNGGYTFGGGAAPVLDSNNQPTAQTTTITGIEQYRRAILGLPGGAPTAYNNVAGSPTVRFTQVRNAAFFQDDYKLPHGVQISYGVRYYIQNDPLLLSSLVPRLGILWSPNKKGTWTLHAHAGIFSGRIGFDDNSEVLREDGVNRITSTIYSPNCPAFNAGTCNPFSGATVIHSLRQFSPHIGNISWAAENIGGTRSLPHGFNLSADLYFGRLWNGSLTRNINSPLNNSPTGPRPGQANLNILQVQSGGQGTISAQFIGIEQHTLKHVQFFFGTVHVRIIDDNNDTTFNAPQSSTSMAGELAPRANQPEWNVFGNATFTLPYALQLSNNIQGHMDMHYNVTTGFDNNGDGNFNDRPQYALAGTPTCAANPKASPCSYITPYGALVASGGTGQLRRDEGVMPWRFYLDTNLQRAFAINNPKSEHPQKVTLNIRAANILNHTNVTSVGGVLGSPQFGQSYGADPGRRVEAGLRYTF